MWTLKEIREEYDRLDRYLGIDTRLIRLSFSKKMRRQHGVCCFRGDRPTEIRLADFLRADDDAMLDTARHEYAHAAAALLTCSGFVPAPTQCCLLTQLRAARGYSRTLPKRKYPYLAGGRFL